MLRKTLSAAALTCCLAVVAASGLGSAPAANAASDTHGCWWAQASSEVIATNNIGCHTAIRVMFKAVVACSATAKPPHNAFSYGRCTVEGFSCGARFMASDQTTHCIDGPRRRIGMHFIGRGDYKGFPGTRNIGHYTG